MRRRRARRAGVVAVAVSVVALATAGAVAVRAQEVGDSFAGRAWVDDPLDGAAVPDGQLLVVGHAWSPNGLVNVTLVADGAPVDERPGGHDLVTARWNWTPSGPGRHLLVVRGVQRSGSFDSSPVVVFVGGPPDGITGPVPTDASSTTTSVGSTTIGPTTVEPTSTAGPTSTGAPTTTARPTTTAEPTTSAQPTTTARPTTLPTVPPTTACRLEAPQPDFPTGGAHVADRTPTLRWTPGPGCTPVGYVVEVSRDPSFVRLEASGSTGSTSWTVPSPLVNCTTFYWRVRGTLGRALGPWSVTASFVTDFGRC